MDNKIIIGISGKMGTGKSTVTKLLTESLEEVNVQKISHSAPMYKLQDLIYKELGLTLEGEKDRDLLIALGMWGRTKSTNFWLEQVAKTIMESDKNIFICDDVRFENEADFFTKYGTLIRIEGEQRGANVDHSRSQDASECALDSYKFENIISNNTNPEDMCKQIAYILQGGKLED